MLVAFYLSQIFIGILGFGFVLSAILIAVFLILLFFWLENKEYKASSYYQITKTPLYAVKYNVGKYGEYLIYKYLNEYETIGAKFLFNVYIPKKNGETTEIDVLMISHKGIYVFESKNFSGWIFGDEKQRYWYQTLPIGRRRSQKEKFFNPILQNRTHISHLQSFLDRDVPI